MNEETAYQEFIQLLYNDPDFEDQWGYNDKEQQKNAFCFFKTFINVFFFSLAHVCRSFLVIVELLSTCLCAKKY